MTGLKSDVSAALPAALWVCGCGERLKGCLFLCAAQAFTPAQRSHDLLIQTLACHFRTSLTPHSAGPPLRPDGKAR